MLLMKESCASISTTLPAASAAVAGAACSPSAARIFTRGFFARIAAATPTVRLPPPMGVSTQSGSGKSSRISSPMEPLPMITPASVTGLINSSAPSGAAVSVM